MTNKNEAIKMLEALQDAPGIDWYNVITIQNIIKFIDKNL